MNKIYDWRDVSGDVAMRLKAELAKQGITEPKSDDRQSMVAYRADLRRAVNAITERTRNSVERSNGSWNQTKQREMDEALETVDAIAATIKRIDGQLDFMEGVGSSANASSESWHGDNGSEIKVLARGDRMTSIVGESRPSFGFGSFIKAMVAGTGNHDIRNALSEGTDSAGGYTVPKYLMADVIDRMRAKTTVIQAGALTVPLETQVTTIARLASDPTAGWRLENAAIAESDPTFEGVTFTARSLAVLVKISRELLEDSVNIDQALANAFAGAMAVELDRVSLLGSGTAPEPRGVSNVSGINSVSMGTNGAALTNHAKLLDCLLELQQDNAADPTAAIMAPRTWRTIQGFADTTGQPLQPPPALASLPQLVTTSMPINQTQGTATNASSIIVGDFSQLMIGVRQELRIEVLRELFAENHQYAFVAHLRADVAVAHPESFCKLIGVTP